MTKHKRCSLVWLILLFACSPKPKVTVTAKRIVIRQISLESIQLVVRYEVHNPHPVDISILDVHQELELSQVVAARGRLESPVSIPAHKRELVEVRMILPFLPLLPPVKDLLMGKSIRYRLTSDMKLKTVFGTENRKLLREGDLELPLLPGGGIVNINNMRFEGGPMGTLLFDLKVRVPRPRKQLMATTQVKYALVVDKNTIADGRFHLVRGPENFQEVTIPISWPLGQSTLWLPKLASGLRVHFTLRFDLGDETEFLIDENKELKLNSLFF